MKTWIFWLVLTSMNFSAANILGQNSTSPQTDAQRQAAIERSVREETGRQFERLKAVSENSRVKTQTEERISGAEPKSGLKTEQKFSLEPDLRDVNFYRDFLKQPNTGLIKLFPDAGCQENSRILRADAACLNQIPNSSFYSFRREKHVTGIFADVRYKEGFFVSDGILAQGIMTNLGDVRLEEVALTNENLKFIVHYNPEPVNHQAAEQMKKIIRGIRDGKYFYRNAWQAEENQTYILRSIAYRGKIPYQVRGFVFNLLDRDKRKDVIVVFRVVRKNSDGSITLLWKELNRRDAPKLIIQKNNINERKQNKNEK